MTALIEAGGLHVYYGASHVLRGIDMHIAPGESVGLVGRNGMGKTTLIRSLMGHVRSAQGSVRVDGRDCTRAQPHAIARMGVAYVPEGRAIFPNLNVRENLQVAARAGRDGRQDWTYARVLEVFPRLRERLGHGGQQLSGGEQQMLAIGRALVTNPRLLILDEATEGLAPKIREEIWNCLARLRQAGQTILVIDKYVERLLSLADRHVILERGKVVWTGDSQALDADRGLWERYLGV